MIIAFFRHFVPNAIVLEHSLEDLSEGSLLGSRLEKAVTLHTFELVSGEEFNRVPPLYTTRDLALGISCTYNVFPVERSASF
jgi:hypothetical protein